MADFLLLLYSIPSFDRSLNGEVHLDWSVGAKNVDRKLFEGINTFILLSVKFFGGKGPPVGG